MIAALSEACNTLLISQYDLPVVISSSAAAPTSTMTPLVSVIVPVRNAFTRGIAVLLDSLASQTHRNIEIIAIDSGSTDRTAEWLASKGVKVVSIPSGEFTHAASRNLGAEHAHGSFLLFTVDDACFSDPSWIRQNIDLLEQFRADALSSRQSVGGSASLHAKICNFLHHRGIGDKSKVVISRTQWPFRLLQRILPLRLKAISLRLDCTNLLVRTNVFRELRFNAPSNEDRELAMRLIQRRKRILYTTASSILHHHNYTTKDLVRYSKRIFLDTQTTSKWDWPTTQMACAKNTLALAFFALRLSYDLIDSNRLSACASTGAFHIQFDSLLSCVKDAGLTLGTKATKLEGIAPVDSKAPRSSRYASSVFFRVIEEQPNRQLKYLSSEYIKFGSKFFFMLLNYLKTAKLFKPCPTRHELYKLFSLVWCEWLFSSLARNDTPSFRSMNLKVNHWKIADWN